MANNYVRPALHVYQQVDDTVTTPGDHLATCLVGASYELYRYGYEELTPTTYSAGGEVAIPGLIAPLGETRTLDKDSVSLYGTGLWATLTASCGFEGEAKAADPFVVEFSGVVASDAGTSALTTDKISYPAEVGDIIVAKASESDIRTAKVLEVIKDSSGDSKKLRVDTVMATVGSNNTLTDTEFTDVQIYKPVDAELKHTLSSDGTKAVITAGQTVELPAYDAYSAHNASLFDTKGDVYLSCRVLKFVDEEGVIEIADSGDDQSALGAIAPENDLAEAAYCALKGGEGRPVYVVRVAGQTPADYTKAMEQTDSDASLYNFVAVTDDVKCMDAVVAFNASQSTPERKHWRATYIGASTPAEYQVAKDKTVTAVVSKSGTKAYVTLTSGIDGFDEIPLNGILTTMRAKDKVEIASKKYTIAEVTPTTLTLVDGADAAGGAQTIKLFKSDSAANAAEYVTSIADSFSDHRVAVVWSDKAQGIDGVIDNKYIAATVAGYASSIEPQAPMTRAEVPTVTSASRMYLRHTQKDLDEIAKHGVLIVTQDTKGGPCYIRHQLTTEMDKGVLYQEISVTKNLDTISYAISDALETHVGRSNITPSAIDAVHVKVLNTLTDFTANSTDPKIGPALGRFEDLKVYQDPTFVTRVVVKVKLYLPVPMNNIDVYLMTYAYDNVTGSFTVTSEAA